MADDQPITQKRQLALEKDWAGFAFAPSHLMDPYIDDKYLDKNDKKGTKKPWVDRDKVIAAKIFTNMAYFVSMRHGIESSDDLIPSLHLDVELSGEQRSLLNPSPRDVQLAAILEQCQGKGAARKTSARRIDEYLMVLLNLTR